MRSHHGSTENHDSSELPIAPFNSNYQHSETGPFIPATHHTLHVLPAWYALGEPTAAPVSMAETMPQDHERRGAAFAASVQPHMNSPEGTLVQHVGGASPSPPEVCAWASAFPPDT
jgi:hypothetical protein